jgi:hypothetical protein
MTILNLLFLLFVLGIANIAYKGKVLDKTSWNRVAILSGLFIVCSFVLLGANIQKLFITLNLPTLGIFMITTLIWFLFPKIIRHYGKFPNSYLKDKKGNIRFMVRFEYPTMTIKYFEVLFQQVTFLFIIFVALSGLSTATTIFLFTLIVVIIHLGNLLFMDCKWALFYTLLSVPMALLFSFMINQGLVLVTASIHLTFYLVFNARYWFDSKYQ